MDRISTRRTITRRYAPTLLGLAVSTGAMQIMAQSPEGLQEITVTAQFREQNLQQTPLAITAFNDELMDARSQTSIFEVSAQAPNVTLKPNSAVYGPSMTASIRGVGQTDFNPAFEPGVGMYVDDVYYATVTGSIFDLLDLDRVEILRGPQGTLAGRNSIGGAVKMYSKEPVGDGTGSVQVTYGIRDRLDVRASADFALSDNWTARLAGVSKKQQGYVDRLDYGCVHPDSGIPALSLANASGDCVTAKEGEIDYTGGRAMFHFDDGGPITADIIADYTHDDRTQAAGVLIYGAEADTTPGDIDPFDVPLGLEDFVVPDGAYYNYASYVHMEDGPGNPTRVTDGRTYYRGWGLSGQVDWQLSDTMLLESITAYREYESGFSNDNDFSPLAYSLGNGYMDFWSWSQEFRLSGSLDNNFMDWTLGFFYMDQESIYGSLQDLRYSGLPAFWQDDPTAADSLALFAHADWYLTQDLTLVTGLRWTDESKTYKFLRRTPLNGEHPVLGALDGEVGEYEGDRVDYRLGLQYQLTDAIMGYAQVSTGFKGGGINPRPFFASQVESFGQEKLTSYEAGIKSMLFDRRMRLNAAVFFSDYSDIQMTASSCPDFTPTPTGAPCALPFNAGDAEMRGFELETDFQLDNGLGFDASLSYLDFEYQSINPLVTDIHLDDEAPYTPDVKASAGVQYEIPLGRMGTLTPRVDVSHQGDVFTDPTNAPINQIDAYTLTNFRLMWRSADEDWNAALEVTNATDEYYFMTIWDQQVNGIVNAQPGRPMEWAVTLERNF